MNVDDDSESAVDRSSSEKTLTFDDDPSLNPRNLSQTLIAGILTAAFVLVATSTVGSSLASAGASSTVDNFGLSDDYGWRVLSVFVYFVGYFIGNTVLAPLGEHYGRRPVNLITEFGFLVFMMATGLAPNWAAFNVFRLLDGFFAAGPLSTIAG